MKATVLKLRRDHHAMVPVASWVPRMRCPEAGCSRYVSRRCEKCGMARCSDHVMPLVRFKDCGDAGHFARTMDRYATIQAEAQARLLELTEQHRLNAEAREP